MMVIGMVSAYLVFEKNSLGSGLGVLICGYLSQFIISSGEEEAGVSLSLTWRLKRSPEGVIFDRYSAIFLFFLILGFAVFTASYIASEMGIRADYGHLHEYHSAGIENIAIGDDGSVDCETIQEIEGIVYSVTKKEEVCTIRLSDVMAILEDEYGVYAYAPVGDVIASYGDEEFATDADIADLIGTKLRLRGELSRANEASNPASFDYRLYLKSLGMYYTFRAREIGVEDTSVPLSYRHLRLLIRWREGFLSLFEDEKTRGFIRGIIFGDKSEIDEETREVFNENGTGHVLAVSGLHVGFLYSLIRFITRKRKTIATTILTILILFIYGEMTLWSASTIRAVLVLSFAILSLHLRRSFDLLSSVSASAMVILIANPYQLVNASFQLSFMALLGISYLSQPLAAVLGNVLGSLLAIQLAIIPISAFLFNRLNLLSIFINIPVIALSSVIVPFYMLLLIIYAVTMTIPSFAILISEGLCDLMLRLNEALAYGGAYSNLVISMEPAFLILGYAIAFFLSSEWFRVEVFRKNIKKLVRVLILLIVLAFVLHLGTYNEFADDEFVFVDVGQGSCIHVRTPEGRNILIDGGGSEEYSVAKKVLQPYLLKNGVRRVNLAVATHMDTDHYKGLAELIELGMIERIVTNGDGYSAGDIIYEEDGFRIRVVAPIDRDSRTQRRSELDDEENESSLVIRIEYGDVSCLATGDIGKETEMGIVEAWKHTGSLGIDILAVPHHGSKNSSSEDFIEACSPKIAVVQVGRNNMYGHPARETIEAYEAKGIRLLRNDMDGAIGIDISSRSKGKSREKTYFKINCTLRHANRR